MAGEELGLRELEMSETEHTDRANEIDVMQCRQFLLLPLLIGTGVSSSGLNGARRDGEKWLAHAANQLTGESSSWTELNFPKGKAAHEWGKDGAQTKRESQHGGQANRRIDAEGFLYFHPFVRPFLYGGHNGRAARVFERSDVDRLDVRLPGEGTTGNGRFGYSVEGITLYLFETGVALLSVELQLEEAYRSDGDAPEGPGDRRRATLADVELLQERIRHAYPPFWINENTPGNCPDAMWWSGGGTRRAESDFHERKKEYHDDYVAEHGVPHLAHHWRWLLEPLEMAGTERRDGESAGGPLSCELIGDDRIPLMTYLEVKYPRCIDRGDWVRLTFLDGPGEHGTLPYSASFLRDFEQGFCYDRFWNPTPAPDEKWQSTRFSCAGYSFTIVSDGSFPPIRDHFRNQYFRLGLIAFFHRASLLAFEKRLAEASALRDESEARGDSSFSEFRNRISEIQADLLKFQTTYWFTEVSNQVQGTELFELWRNHLRTRELFDEVAAEVRSADEILDRWEEKEQTRATTRLTIVATVFLVILPVAELFIEGFVSASIPPGWPIWGALGFGVVGAVLFWALVGVLYWTIRASVDLGNWFDRLSKPVRSERPSKQPPRWAIPAAAVTVFLVLTACIAVPGWWGSQREDGRAAPGPDQREIRPGAAGATRPAGPDDGASPLETDGGRESAPGKRSGRGDGAATQPVRDRTATGKRPRRSPVSMGPHKGASAPWPRITSASRP
jgi:hypothetical protein